MKFTQYAQTWLETKADVSARTHINIEGRLNNHGVPHFGTMRMSDIRPSTVRAFVSTLTASGKAPSTVKAIYLTVSQVFAQAALDGVVARTPCLGITLPSDRRREEMHFLNPTQVNELAAIIDNRYRALVYAAAYAGLRAGELVALKVASVDVLGGSISVNCAASEVRGELVFGPTKNGRSRVVSIPRFLAQMLGEHIGQYPSADGFVFTSREGGSVRHRNFYRRHFRPSVAKAHAQAIAADREADTIPEGLRFHDLRHTCAAILISDGRHMEEVKDHLGHGSIRVTSDRYGHLFPSARLALAEGLEAVFQGTATDPAADKPRTAATFRLCRGLRRPAS